MLQHFARWPRLVILKTQIPEAIIQFNPLCIKNKQGILDKQLVFIKKASSLKKNKILQKKYANSILFLLTKSRLTPTTYIYFNRYKQQLEYKLDIGV